MFRPITATLEMINVVVVEFQSALRALGADGRIETILRTV